MFHQSYQKLYASNQLQQQKMEYNSCPNTGSHTCAMAAKFPRKVLYSPDLYEGMNIQHPYYKQGIQKIITCIQGSAIGSQTGKLIKFSAEEFMLKIDITLTL